MTQAVPQVTDGENEASRKARGPELKPRELVREPGIEPLVLTPNLVPTTVKFVRRPRACSHPRAYSLSLTKLKTLNLIPCQQALDNHCSRMSELDSPLNILDKPHEISL